MSQPSRTNGAGFSIYIYLSMTVRRPTGHAQEWIYAPGLRASFYPKGSQAACPVIISRRQFVYVCV